MKQKLQLTVAIIAIAAVFYFVYHVEVVVPREDAAAALIAEQEANERMKQCFTNVYGTYSEEWDTQCVEYGAEPDCSLIPPLAEPIEARHLAAQDHCIQIHK